MHQQPIEAQSNFGHRPEATSASMQILAEMIRSEVNKLVLTTADLARLLQKTEAALRLAEARHRSRHGVELLPRPLLKNGGGRIWSVLQIAEWMVSGGCQPLQSAAGSTVPINCRRGPGRPRKSSYGSAE